MKKAIIITLAFTCAIFATPTLLGGQTPPAGPIVEMPVESPWTFDLALNMFLAGLSGDVTARGIPTEVDASFGDIIDHFEAGAAGRFTVGYERWFLTTEFSYMKLGASASAAGLELEQWLVEPSIGYSVCDSFEVFAGARYNSLSGDLAFKGPLGVVATGTQEWWDPIVGMHFSILLIGRRFTFDGHFDVGGFGASSDITWQAYPHFRWRFAEWGSAQLGYRWLGTDYETGSGRSKFHYDVIAHGPQVGFTIHF